MSALHQGNGGKNVFSPQPFILLIYGTYKLPGTEAVFLVLISPCTEEPQVWIPKHPYEEGCADYRGAPSSTGCM